MAAKKTVVLIISILIFGTNIYATDWATISGNVVNEDGTPLCAMVLANGQHMFSCAGQGRYELNVPLDEKGELILYCFVEGFSPFKQVMEPATDFEIKMIATEGLPTILTNRIIPTRSGWVNISGTFMNEDGTPLCGMVLANGQHMFSCAGEGRYELDIPLDPNGNIVLYGFAEGFAPYTENLSGIVMFPTGNQDFTAEDGDSADPLFAFRLEFPEDATIPESKDWSSYIPDVGSQGATSSCTSWAVGYYYKTYQEVIEEGWDKNTNAFSPMYLYSMQCRDYEKYGSTSPWNFDVSGNVLKNNGCAKLSKMPFEFLDTEDTSEIQAYASVYISEDIQNEANQYRAGQLNYFKSLSEVRYALTSGPVLLGINYYSDYHRTLNWNPSSENNYLTYDPLNDKVGHAVLCVGYDDSKFGEGAIKFVNSWGVSWAINGYSWIKYSDFLDFVGYAMTINDLANPKTSEPERPDAPADVSASDSEVPYVDITWTKADNAQYYRIYRARVDDSSTYAEIGVSYNTQYRDEKAEPGVPYYYSVVSVNDIGESNHFNTDTETKSYVDVGTASGVTITMQPKLAWVSNNNEQVSSHFIVSNIDPSATKMELFVSTGSDGPWNSFGWIAIVNELDITWGEDSEYVGKQPFVKIAVSNAYAYSKASESAQVGRTIVSPVYPAVILTLAAEAEQASVHLSWTTDGGDADFFEMWRWLASDDDGNQWVSVGATSVEIGSNQYDYYDSEALPGKDYYYAVNAVYKGTSSEHKVIDNPVKIPVAEPNLRLYNVDYEYDQVSSPVWFSITVWNDGGTAFDDYTVAIMVYDWEADEITQVFADILSESGIFKASEYTDKLPLAPGDEHTLVISANIPPVYADGHKYSWIVDVDASKEVDEKYEEDNFIVCSKSWWSTTLPPLPDLQLDEIGYLAGEIGYTTKFDITVSYAGTGTVSDYSIIITAYDWNEAGEVSMYNIKASEVAEPGQLPLQPDTYHILSFSREIPLSFANGHRYSWNIEVNADDIIDEPDRYKDNNSIQSSRLWWLTDPGRRKTAPGKNTGKFVTETNSSDSKAASTRPFSRTESVKDKIVNKEEYAGPIRFKKPSFCINRAE
ncbi:MAG: hypothetical protein GY749_41580 [Desulfobacteraceae bacterium]|nr:hypothetical protein [Desulfobacteraceae bacterium]